MTKQKNTYYTTAIARRTVLDRFAKLRKEVAILSGVEIHGHGHFMDLLATYADDWTPDLVKRLSEKRLNK